jgi:hypothetical protein
MQKKANIHWFLAFFLVCFAAIFCYILFFSDSAEYGNESSRTGKNVIISDKPIDDTAFTSVPLKNMQEVENRHEQADIIAKNNPVAHAIPVSASNQLSIHIQDYLGEPIASAKLTINDTFIPLSNGIGIFNVTNDIPLRFHAFANGYSDFNEQQNAIPGSPLVIQLEYNTDYSISVVDEAKNPVKQATVSLYSGFAPPRPVQQTASFSIAGTMNFDAIQIQTNYRDGEISIGRLIYVNPKSKTQPLFPDNLLQIKGYVPETGNPIIRIADCSQFGGNQTSQTNNFFLNQSPKLRIWDTLAALPIQPIRTDWTKYEKVTFLDSKEYPRFSKLLLPPSPPSLLMMHQMQTDRNGKALFKSIEPGIYFVQAEKERAVSQIKPLLPIQSTIQLSLNDSCKLSVQLNRKGIDINLGGDISGLSGIGITLQGLEQENAGILTASSDKGGAVTFSHLKKGLYSLTINHTTLISDQIEIDEPEEVRIYVLKDGFTIHGIVLDSKTQQPLQDIELLLFRCNPGKDYGICHTNIKGEFAFDNVISGEYEIYLIPHFKKNQVYYLANPITDEVQAFFKRDRLLVLQTTVDSESIYETIYLEQGCVTEFKGKVTDQDGAPISGAYLFLDNYKFAESNPQTASNGTFVLLLYSKASNETFTMNLIARCGPLIPSKLVPYKDNDSLFTVENERVDMQAEGKQSIRFTPGDTIEDIHIVVDASQMKSIHGKIKTSDNKWPILLSIFALQDFSKRTTEIKDDGQFIIHGLSPGLVTLFIKSSKVEFQSTLYGSYQSYEYAPVTIDFQYPADKDDMFMNVLLEKAGFIAGLIQNPNSTTANKNLSVQITSLTDPKISKTVPVNDGGLFLCKDIPAHHEYRIEIIDSNTNRVIHTQPRQFANHADITLSINQ